MKVGNSKQMMLVWLVVLHWAVRMEQCWAEFTIPGDKGYDEEFFENHRKHLPAFQGLADVLYPTLVGQSPTGHIKDVSVLDVGCGHGLLVESLRNLGVAQSYCIEGSASAQSMWPSKYVDQFYRIHDLEKESACDSIVKTDVVISSEVAEHIDPERAKHFISLLTLHSPQMIIFGAATPFQDRGRNPTHVNENSFKYWIEIFRSFDYIVDWTATGFLRHRLLTKPSVMATWWYPKNLLVFFPRTHEARIDKALSQHPKKVDLLSESYLKVFQNSDIGTMWRRDWTDFAILFYDAQRSAIKHHEIHSEL